MVETKHKMNLSLLLAAIAAVETGNNDFITGRHNEISRYQIRAHIWAQYDRILPSRYTNPDTARAVAWQVASDLAKKLPTAQRNNPRVYATAWNWGLTNVRINKFDTYNLPRPVRDYVDRVMNLYDESINKAAPPTLQRSVVPAVGAHH
jgi:hypothetical protein